VNKKGCKGLPHVKTAVRQMNGHDRPSHKGKNVSNQGQAPTARPSNHQAGLKGSRGPTGHKNKVSRPQGGKKKSKGQGQVGPALQVKGGKFKQLTPHKKGRSRGGQDGQRKNQSRKDPMSRGRRVKGARKVTSNKKNRPKRGSHSIRKKERGGKKVKQVRRNGGRPRLAPPGGRSKPSSKVSGKRSGQKLRADAKMNHNFQKAQSKEVRGGEVPHGERGGNSGSMGR